MVQVRTCIGIGHAFAQHGDDGAFHGNGNGFISLFHSGLHGFGEGLCVGFDDALQPFGEACENAREYNAGVTSCAEQHP